MWRVLLKVSVVAPMIFWTQISASQLLIDFNSTNRDGGPHPEPGFQSYDAGHEVAADFITQSYNVVFSGENVTVTITPQWPNSSDSRVQQMLDRTGANWLGDNFDLLTDWIGTDTRASSGGNGDWDRSDPSSTPTYMTLSLGGLPAGGYNWLSYHHDTEQQWADFQVEISTDSGSIFSLPIDVQITSSFNNFGLPPAPTVFIGDIDSDPSNLPSTVRATFVADGVNDVVLRFAPFVDPLDGTGTHKSWFLMNGFELNKVVDTAALPASIPVLTIWGGASLAIAMNFVVFIWFRLHRAV